MGFICLLLVLVSFALGAIGTFAARSVGRRLNALDAHGLPGQIKEAPRRVPNTGGIGVFAGIALPMIAALVALHIGDGSLLVRLAPDLKVHLPGLQEMSGAAISLLASLAVLHAVGLVDDRRPLGPYFKLFIMLGVTSYCCWHTDTRLLTLLDQHVGGPWLSLLITVLWITVITNAFNFLDNMDGLSGGVGALCGAFFLTSALVANQWFVAATTALLVGSLLGFLLFNFPFRERQTLANGHSTGGATIFMGDGGSLIVGFLIAFISVRISYLPATSSHLSLSTHWFAVLTPLVILAIPLYDFCSVTVLRITQGRSPFVGDLQHFSHRLTRHGLSRRAAVLVIYGCTIVTGIGAIALPKLELWQAALVGIQTLAVLAVIALYEYARVPSETRPPERRS